MIPAHFSDASGRPTRAGLKAAALWVCVESGVFLLVGFLMIGLSIPIPSGISFTIEQVASILIFLLLGVIFRRRAEREDLSLEELGYSPISRPVVIVGLTAGVLLLLTIVVATEAVDNFLFPEGAKRAADFLRSLREGGWPAAVLLLPSNGILVPVVEEFAWRGYVQTRLIQGLGLRNGVHVTGLLFAANHIVADVSVFRLTTLFAGSLGLGLIRTRWGTTASTTAHLCANFVATSVAIGQAFVRGS